MFDINEQISNINNLSTKAFISSKNADILKEQANKSSEEYLSKVKGEDNLEYELLINLMKFVEAQNQEIMRLWQLVAELKNTIVELLPECLEEGDQKDEQKY